MTFTIHLPLWFWPFALGFVAGVVVTSIVLAVAAAVGLEGAFNRSGLF